MIRAHGNKELGAYLDGAKLTVKQAVRAKCAECMGNYQDGKADCRIPECPLYPHMPYGVIWKGRSKKITPPKPRNSAHWDQKGGEKEGQLDVNPSNI